MPISRDQFRSIDDSRPRLDLAEDTTQGRVFRFLLEHADQAFRQRELIDAIDVPAGSIGPTLKRLEEHGLVEHRDRFWTIADNEHAVAAATRHTAATVDALDGGFPDSEIHVWSQAAVDPIERESDDPEA